MKKLIVFVIFAFLLVSVSAKDCTNSFDNMEINSSIKFCSDSFDLASGMRITQSNIVLDCGTAVLRGILGRSERGITIENVKNVTVKNCNIATYNIALLMKNVTHSLIEDNAFLKGRIGIRMLDSYENLVQDNVDKSTTKAISAVNSKFNVVMLDNKNIEQGFCDVNTCNKQSDVNPCVDDDFYCSDKCNESNDNDCAPFKPEKKLNISQTTFEEKVKELESVNDAIGKLIKESVSNKELKNKFPWGYVIIFAIIIYSISFLVYRSYKKFQE